MGAMKIWDRLVLAVWVILDSFADAFLVLIGDEVAIVACSVAGRPPLVRRRDE